MTSNNIFVILTLSFATWFFGSTAIANGPAGVNNNPNGTTGKWRVDAGLEDQKRIAIIDFSNIDPNGTSGPAGRNPLSIVYLCATGQTSPNPSTVVRFQIRGKGPKFQDKAIGTGPNGLGCIWLPLRPRQILYVYSDGKIGHASGTWGLIK